MRGLEIQQKILTVGIGVIKLPQCSWIETCKYLMIIIVIVRRYDMVKATAWRHY